MSESNRFESPINNVTNNTKSFHRQNLEPYEPPESLWQLIKSVANERELDTIKSIIGESLIETSIDLHNEIDSLLEIWRDYRYETTVSINQIDQKGSKNISLPEPPNIRETLKKEINFFVKQMREQYKGDDQFRRQIATNNHNLNVINYVLNSALSNNDIKNTETSSKNSTPTRSRSLSERPITAINKRTGIETPVIMNSTDGRESRQRVRYRPVSRSSSLNSARSELRSVNSNYDDLNVPNTLSENLEQYVDEDKINCMQIDEIADHLRELLQEECDVLLKDTEFLYECIDQEREYRVVTRTTLREPSLNELKEERKRLESDLMSATSRNQAKISKLPASVSGNKSNRSINSPLIRPTPSPPSSASSTRSRISVISTNNIKIIDQSNKPVVKRSSSLIKQTVKTSSIKATPVINTPTIRRLTSNNITQKVVTTKTNVIKSQTNGKERLESAGKPTLSRTNSVSSIASSCVSSSISDASSRLSAAQKFRQMVLESRDD